jgi:pyruvate dehydrogenase E1 component alpha subunit
MIKYSKAFLSQLYETMLKIRLCELSFIAPIIKGDVKCPVHLYSGQEAVATGVCAALNGRDGIFGNHRSHGHYLAKGGGLKELVAEIYGKETGCSRGRGGSMHVCDPDRGMLGAVPIVGGTISLALGTALASSIRKDEKVTVSFFGDGATGEGALHESLNFSALKKLPLIFVCENNFYSTHMPILECRPNKDIYKIGMPYGIKNFRVDGNDVLKVLETAKKAVELCRRGKGPVLIECLTYRLHGHVGPDDNIQGTHTDIRPKKEIKVWEKKDPIKQFERYLFKNKVLRSEEMLKIKKAIDQEIKSAYNFMEKSFYPQATHLADYVYKN